MTASTLDPAVIEATVDGMLGKPFLRGGNGPHGYYCVGIVCELMRTCAGITVPDPFYPGPLSEERLAQFRSHFLQLDGFGDLHPLDVLYSTQDHNAHLSVVENVRWVVSVNEFEGVIRVPLDVELRWAISAHRLKQLL